MKSLKCGKKIRVPSPIQNTIHNKALLIFEAQPTRRFLIASWFTQTDFGLIYFDRAGEIRATWDFNSHDNFIRLIAGLAFCEENALGYDPLVIRRNGEATDILVKGDPLVVRNGEATDSDRYYHIIRCLFKAATLRGRGTVCWLVEKDSQNFVIKDTWADVGRQWQESGFLEMCKERNIRNVPYLEDAVEISADSTHRYRDKIVGTDKIEKRAHRRLVLQPICATLDKFASKMELLCALVDQIKSEF